MKLLQAALLIAAGSIALAMPAQAQAVYRYCMIGTPNMGMDCTFATLQQCQVTASAGVGFCQENSAYVANARQPEPAKRKPSR